jgi:drug/metabolite transporter (DMT)-like permease
MSRRNWALFAAMCVIWGIPYLLIRVAVRDVAPGTLVFLRTGIGGLVLLPLALRGSGFRPVLARWRPLLAFTVAEMALPWLLLSDAERRLSSSVSGLLIAAVPFVSVLVSRVVGAERSTRMQLLGLLIGLSGTVALVGLDFGSLDAGSLGEVVVVVIGYATAPMIMSRSLADLPSLPVITASLLLVAVGYLPYAVLRWPTGTTGTELAALLVLGTVCTALAFVVFFALIAGIGPSRALVITYVNPAVAVGCGVVFLAEPFTTGMAVGFPLILAGSVLGARRGGAGGTPVPEGALAAGLECGADQTPQVRPGGGEATVQPQSGDLRQGPPADLVALCVDRLDVDRAERP